MHLDVHKGTGSLMGPRFTAVLNSLQQEFSERSMTKIETFFFLIEIEQGCCCQRLSQILFVHNVQKLFLK